MLIDTPRSTEGKGKKISIVGISFCRGSFPTEIFFCADSGLTKIYVTCSYGGVEGGEGGEGGVVNAGIQQ